MFVWNFKLDKKKIFKIIFVILFIIIILMCGAGIYRLFNSDEKTTNPDLNKTLKERVNVISSNNYTNVLKAVHSDIDTYLGQKIKFTGFVYRLYDFDESQFVLGRQMIISSDMQAVVVGFLCHLNEAGRYNDYTWVEVEGTITKGDYHGEIPVIEIYKIKEVKTPSDEYVYPPDETYVQTNARVINESFCKAPKLRGVHFL